MSGFRLEGLSGRINEVDSYNTLDVSLPTDKTQIGTLGLAAINHDGAVGAAKMVRPCEVSINKRLRTGLDSMWFNETFYHSGPTPSSVWSIATAETMGFSATTAYATLNSTNVTGATNTVMNTWKFFPLYNGAGIGMEFDAILPQATDATTKIEMGWFQATGTAAVSDGVLFRLTNNNSYGIINNNGTEVSVTLGFIPDTNEHEYIIRFDNDTAEFWIDGNLYGTTTTTGTELSAVSMASYQPITIRTIGTSTTVASFKIAAVRLFIRDVHINRSWAQIAAGMGGMASQGYGGIPQGTTALFANNQAAGAGQALTNTGTTPTAYSGLGGQFDFTPTLTANNDGVLFYYNVPTGGWNKKSLVITGIRIQSCVSTTLTLAAPMYLVYSLAYGSSGLSLASAESATAKAYRRIPLGQEVYTTVNAPQGTLGIVGGTANQTGITFTPSAPIIVNAGENLAVAVKNTGTVTTGGVITAIVTIDAYWE